MELRNLMRFRAVAILAIAALPAFGQDGEQSAEAPPALEIIDVTLPEHRPSSIDRFQWLNRPIIVLADSPNDPRFSEQMELLQEEELQLLERDVIVLTDTSPASQSELRNRFRPRGFSILIVGKDGEVKLRKPFPWSVREITRAIDKFPLRQQEIRAR